MGLLVNLVVVNVAVAVPLLSSAMVLLLMVTVLLIIQSNPHGHTCTSWPLRLSKFRPLVAVNLLTMPTLAVNNSPAKVDQMTPSTAVNRLSKLQITIIYSLYKMNKTVQFST